MKQGLRAMESQEESGGARTESIFNLHKLHGNRVKSEHLPNKIHFYIENTCTLKVNYTCTRG